MSSLLSRSSRIWVFLYFGCLFAVGLACFSDYGISTDEAQQRLIGQTSLSFLGHFFQIPSLLNGAQLLTDPVSIFDLQKDRDYGVIFELPAELLVTLLQLEGKEIFYFRHWLTFLIFFIGSVYFYKIIVIRYQKWQWGLIATTLLVLSPRIFGDAFFNDKDLVFLSLFVIASFTLVQWLEKPNYKSLIAHAFACALAIDVRIMGILIPLLTIGIMILQLWIKPHAVKKILFELPIYLALTFALIALFWPWLWQDPFGNIGTAFKNMARFRHIVDMVFFGEAISSGNVPWTYVPVWLGVTTPILYSALFVVGVAVIVHQTLKAGWTVLRQAGPFQDLIFIALFFAPLGAVIVLHSVLYNGWRQMYFIYPAFIVIAIRGLVALWNICKDRKLLKPALAITVTLCLSYTAYWMVRWHPYQYLYFNILAGESSKRFDVDYWGVAYREPLEKILGQSSADTFAIHFKSIDQSAKWGYWQMDYLRNLALFSKRDSDRIIIDRTEACSDYVFTTLMGNRQQYLLNKPEFSVFHELKVDGQIVYTTFKRNVVLYEHYQPAIAKPIDFGNRNTQCFLREDWGQNEDWGVWSTGSNPQLALFMPSGKPKSLILDMRAFIHAKHPKQTVKISINGVEQKTVSFTTAQHNQITLPIPPSTYGKEWIEIGFDLPLAISPKELGMGEDNRKLGIGLVSAVFR